MNGLEPPTALDEPARKVIKETRMRWRRALITKVIGGLHQSLTKVMMPEPIHDHARQEFTRAMFSVRQPVAQCCQLVSGRTAPMGIFLARQHLEKTGADLGPGRTPAALAQYTRFSDFDGNSFSGCLRGFLHLIPKRGGELIVFLSRHRVDGMIVATGATEADAEECRASGCHHVIQPVELLVIRVGIILQVRSEMNELAQLLVFLIRHKMEPDKLIEGHILIERADDRIAKAPCVGARLVIVHRQLPTAFTKAHDIEPMPAPAFAVSGLFKQPLHQSLVGLGFLIGYEPVDLIYRGRQAGEAEGQPADQGIAVSLRLGLEIFGMQLGEDEGIDGRASPCIFFLRHSGCSQPLQTP